MKPSSNELLEKFDSFALETRLALRALKQQSDFILKHTSLEKQWSEECKNNESKDVVDASKEIKPVIASLSIDSSEILPKKFAKDTNS